MTAGRSRREGWRDASACPAICVRAGERESKAVNRRTKREKKDSDK